MGNMGVTGPQMPAEFSFSIGLNAFIIDQLVLHKWEHGFQQLPSPKQFPKPEKADYSLFPDPKLKRALIS